jgi:hypothetical protein
MLEKENDKESPIIILPNFHADYDHINKCLYHNCYFQVIVYY